MLYFEVSRPSFGSNEWIALISDFRDAVVHIWLNHTCWKSFHYRIISLTGLTSAHSFIKPIDGLSSFLFTFLRCIVWRLFYDSSHYFLPSIWDLLSSFVELLVLQVHHLFCLRFIRLLFGSLFFCLSLLPLKSFLFGVWALELWRWLIKICNCFVNYFFEKLRLIQFGQKSSLTYWAFFWEFKALLSYCLLLTAVLILEWNSWLL